MQRFAAFSFDRDDHFPFCPETYSRFKYGCGAAAQQLGEDLAVRFWAAKFRFLPANKPIVVLSSPYCFIPTATFYLKNHFVDFLNHWLAEESRPPVEETKIHRTVTYKDDYGALSAEERMRLIQNDCFHIDRAFVRGKTLLFLDDIRITGTHEHVVAKMMNEHAVEADPWFLYFANLTNPAVSPQVENRLNYAYVRSLSEVAEIARSGRFCINTRVVKFILSAPPAECQSFLASMGEGFRRLVYFNAIGNGYHTMDGYVENLATLREKLALPLPRILSNGIPTFLESIEN